jgi:hypothetical protein
MSDFRQLAQDIGSAPLGDLIAAIGRGVAEAQAALDAGSLEQTLELYEQSDDLVQTLRELGYRPTFYTIPETEGELKLSLTVAGQLPTRPTAPVHITRSARSSLPRFAPRPRVYAAPVDGRYQNSFSFTGEVSATVKFKVVAVPPPSEAEQARVAPDFVGTSYADALTLADSFDLGLVVEDGTEPAADDTIETQDIAGGTIVVAGSTITITV